jgi:gliding motility-associated-like protein
LVTITHTTTGATGIGVATGLPTGVSAIFSSDMISIIGTPTISGTFNYSIPLTGGCGSASATGTIIVLDFTKNVNCRGFFIPEAFSPNDDGVNDFFEIIGIENYPNNELIVVNRWGNKVYETKGYKNNWDGTNQFGLSFADKELPVGTYFYILDLGPEVSEDERYKKGYVYISRKK